MLSKRCLVIADRSEIAATLRHYTVEDYSDSFYSTPIGDVIITGWGEKSVRKKLQEHIAHYEEFWNIGFAGALDDSLKLFSVHAIAMIGRENASSHQLSQVGKRLLTVEKPLHQPECRPSGWDLVDMEGYVVAEMCLPLGKKCCVWKIVSDYVSEGGSELIHKNREILSQIICEHLIHESSRHP